MRTIEIDTEPVALCRILKFENLVMSGGEAKHVIANEMVCVNGKVETRKQKKIYSGDIIRFGETTMKITLKKGDS